MKNIQIFIPDLKTNVEFLIGTDKNDNFKIIDIVNENDFWFHIKGFPSCHVVSNMYNDENQSLPTISKKILRKIIVQGACICKSHSKYKSDKNVEIVYTKIKNVTKTEIMGSVVLSEEKTIVI